MEGQADRNRRRGYGLALAALAVGVAVGLLLPAVLPAAARSLLPGSCTDVRNEVRQIRVDASEAEDSGRLVDALALLEQRPDCFGDHEREELEGLREFLETAQGDS